MSEDVSRLPNIIFTLTGTDDNKNKVGTGTGHRRFNCKFAPVFKMKIEFFCDIRTCTASRFSASCAGACP